MSKVIVLGGGLCGLASALMLARDGHEVTVLERDPAPVPESPERAWEALGAQRRRAVPAGALHAAARAPGARRRAARRARRAPGGRRRRAATGRACCRPRSPTARRGRATSELMTVTARRPTLEQAIGERGRAPGRGSPCAAASPWRGSRPREHAGSVHVTGVRTEDGATLVRRPRRRRDGPPLADARAAARGRRARGRPRRAADSGFVYYTRFFRSADGSTPAPRGPLNSPFESHSILTLPADAGTWSVTLYGAAADPPLKRFRHEPVWTAVMRASPAARALARGRADDGRSCRWAACSTGAGGCPPTAR